MPDKNILASFSSLETAQKCQDHLRHLGFDVVQVDNIGSSDSTLLPHTPLVEWGRYGYQTDRLDDKWTAASSFEYRKTGLAGGGGGWLLTAVVPAERAGTAAHIIEQYGGSI